MTQFVDNENLSKNTLLEIDMAEMTQSHLTGADQSCGLYVSLDSAHVIVCFTIFLSFAVFMLLSLF